MTNIEKTTTGGYSEKFTTTTTTVAAAASPQAAISAKSTITKPTFITTATTTTKTSPPPPPSVNYYNQQQTYNNNHYHHHHEKQRYQQRDKGRDRQQQPQPQPHHHPFHPHQRFATEKSATPATFAANTEAAVDCGDLERSDPFYSSTTISTAHNANNARSCPSHVLQVLFSTPGLVLLVVLYSMLGGLLFPLLEAPQDVTKSLAIAKSREDCLRELWIITEKLNVLYERNWTMLVHEQLRRFEGTIVAASRHGGLETIAVTNAGGIGPGGNAVSDQFVGGQFDSLLEARWTFSEALLYSLTIITTIGHGSLTPKTAAGKVATILYALVGVPLMLMCLSSLGVLLADFLQFTYARVCCPLACRGGRNGGRARHQHRHRINQSCESVVDYSGRGKAVRGGGGGAGGGREAEGQAVVRAPQTKCAATTEESECLSEEEKREMLSCKNCKYDAIILEQKTNKGLQHCNLHGTALTRTEDSCSVPYNSAMTINHASPCRQQHASGGAAGTSVPSFYQQSNSACLQQRQQQQQQQQHSMQQYRQHADAIRARNGCGIVHSTAMALPTSLCIQKYTPAVTAAYCSRSLTPSPQQQQQQLLMHPLQQHQIMQTSSGHSSAHSSPTHHHLPNCAKQKPPQQQQYYLHQLQQPQQQQFIAVPSNILRFQAAGAGAGAEAAAAAAATTSFSSDTLNFYQSVSGVIPASATIYVPIVASPATIRKDSTTTTTTTAATAVTTVTIANYGTQFLYNTQPLFKYNTVQLQHPKPTTLPPSLPPPSYIVTAATAAATSAASSAVTNSIMSSSQVTLAKSPALTATTTVTSCDSLSPPLPPPPSYQTATVHGIRRAKFLTKPLTTGNSSNNNNNNHSNSNGNSQRNGLSYNSNNRVDAVLEDCNSLTSESATVIITTTTTTSAATTPKTMPSSMFLAISPASVALLTASNTSTLSAPASASAPTSTSASTVVMATAFHPAVVRVTAAATATTTTTKPSMPRTEHDALNHSTAQMVDIMEDEEENEGHRMGNCPHGTPSRVPLISSACTARVDDRDAAAPNAAVKHQESCMGGRAKCAAALSRGLINSTAATLLQRHALHTFHRGGSRKAVVTAVRKRNCSLQRRSGVGGAGGSGSDSNSGRGGCYGDTTETSDDEDNYLPQGSSDFVLHGDGDGDGDGDEDGVDDDDYDMDDDSADNDDDDHGSVAAYNRRRLTTQVPITVVLLILICYICLGTVFFASWENWSLIDGAYFCFVTLSTIGYGDFLPKQTLSGPDVQLFACCAYLLLGLVLVAMSFSILESQLMWKCRRIAVRLKLVKD